MGKILFISVFILGCGTVHHEVVCTLKGCNSERSPIVKVPADGIDGANGVNGIAGVNGSDGSDGIDGANGSDGIDGSDGSNGINGVNGIAGTNGSDGANGSNGVDGVSSPYQITGLVDPCGATPGFVNEVLLRLTNGMLVASFSANSAGANTRLGVLLPGMYQTTDTNTPGKRCRFTVNADFSLSNEELF